MNPWFNFLDIKALNVLHIKYALVVFALIVIAIYLLSFIGINGDVVVHVHDNLDANVAIYKLLADSNILFADSKEIVPNVLDGIPRGLLPSEYNIVRLLYYFFNPSLAYIVNETLIRIIAFIGMLLLLNSHFLIKNEEKESIIYFLFVCVAILFALLPYWSNGGLSVAGQPLVLYAFLNIKNNKNKLWNWFIFSFFIFYSSLILAGMFVLFMLTLIFIYDCIEKKSLNYQLFTVLPVMSLMYLAVEYRLLLNFIDPAFVSHRVEFFQRF